MNRLEVVRRLGSMGVVGSPVARRAWGLPPGGPRVRRGLWALNAALGRPPEAEATEVAGLVVVRSPEALELTCWSPDGVHTLRLAPGVPLALRGDPVLLVAVGAGVPRVEARAEVVDVLAGPDLDALPRDTMRRFVETGWRVASVSDRVGVRLLGPRLGSTADRFPSAPMTLGAVELPPDGAPIVLGPDHPVTGGYPLLGVLPAYASDDLGCVPLGGPVRFRLVDRETARSRWAAWRRAGPVA